MRIIAHLENQFLPKLSIPHAVKHSLNIFTWSYSLMIICSIIPTHPSARHSHNIILPPLYFTGRMMLSALYFLVFPSSAQTFQLWFLQKTGNASQKCSQFHWVSCFFSCCVWNNGFFLAEWHFSLGLLLLFWSWFVHFAPNHIHSLDREPVSFTISIKTGHYHAVCLHVVVCKDQVCTFKQETSSKGETISFLY